MCKWNGLNCSFFWSNFIQCGPEGAKLVKIPWSCIGRILTGAVGRQNEKRVLNFAILIPILHLLSQCKTCNEGKWKEVKSVLSIWGLGIWQTVDDAEFTWAILLFVEKRCYSWGTVDDVKAILLFAYTQWQLFPGQTLLQFISYFNGFSHTVIAL